MNKKKGNGAGWSPSSTSTSLPRIQNRPNTVGAPGELIQSASAPELAGGRKATALQKGANLRLSAFMDRQLNHPGIEARKAMAVLQRKIAIEGHSADDIGFWGSKGVEGFRVYLRKKFGGIVAGWRALDIDKNGRLSFYEFCNACRKMGYHGNLKTLWRQLDVNGKGFISLVDIDLEVGQGVGAFKMALMKKYGDMLTAWKKGLDTNGTGRIEEQEIEMCLKTLGLDINAKKLYGWLRNAGGLGLTLQDFDPDAHNRNVTGDFKGLTSKANKEFVEDVPGIGREVSMPLDILQHPVPGGARQFRQELAVADKNEVAEAIAENTKLRLGLHTVDGFKSALVNRCGSLLGAWRESLDLDGNQRLTFGEFTKALQRLGFHGDIKGLWKQLDVRGMGYIVFADFDKETDEALTALKTRLCRAYGNMLVAWLKAFDTNGSGSVDERGFVEGCRIAGFEGKDGLTPKQLFRLMQPEAGRRFLTLKDFDIKAYNALSVGDFRMISDSEEPEKKKPMDMTFDERNQSGFFFQIRRSWDVAKRAEFSQACRMSNGPMEFEGKTEAFEELLIRKFGSLINAWRNCLDLDQHGKLTFYQFSPAVRSIGYSGDLAALYKSYDKDKKGYILLKDLDAEADNHVSSFLALLIERYGDLESAWKKGFSKDLHDSIDETELRQNCDFMGYPHDSRKLFKCLQPAPTTLIITIWDLDPVASRKRAQGKDNSGMPLAALSSSPPNSPSKKKPGNAEAPTLDEEGNVADGPEGCATTTNVDNARSSVPEISNSLRLLHLALRKKHGSTVASWRAHFDPELTGAASWGKFVIVAQDCSFSSNLKSVWAELAGDQTIISFSSLDPEGASILDECRKWMLSNYDNILKAWHAAIDPDGREHIDEAEFLNKMVGRVKAPKKLFRLLLSRLGQRSVVVEDLEALLITVAPLQRKAIWGGSPQSPEEAGSGPASPNASMKSGMQASGGHGAPEATDIRRHITKMINDFKSQDRIVSDLKEFKKIMKAKYGSLFAAWRRGLDVDQNGVVTFKDFATACQRSGVKAVQKIWAEFDKNQDGQISLNELDRECSELFNALEQLLIEGYGSTKQGWKKVFDREGSLSCGRDKFVMQCKVAGFQGDGDKLFKLLRPEPGRAFLAYDDLWINVNINEFDLTKPEPNTTQGSPRSARAMSPHNRTQSEVSAAPIPKGRGS